MCNVAHIQIMFVKQNYFIVFEKMIQRETLFVHSSFVSKQGNRAAAAAAVGIFHEKTAFRKKKIHQLKKNVSTMKLEVSYLCTAVRQRGGKRCMQVSGLERVLGCTRLNIKKVENIIRFRWGGPTSGRSAIFNRKSSSCRLN